VVESAITMSRAKQDRIPSSRSALSVYPLQSQCAPPPNLCTILITHLGARVTGGARLTAPHVGAHHGLVLGDGQGAAAAVLLVGAVGGGVVRCGGWVGCVGCGLAVGWLWVGCGLAVGWLWVGCGLAVGWLVAGGEGTG